MTFVKSHGLANRPGEPYPATFRMFQWTHWESNPTMSLGIWPACRAGVFPFDYEPSSGASGNRTPIAWVQTKRLPVGPTPHWFLPEVRPGIEPDPRPYHRRVQPKHLQTILMFHFNMACCITVLCRSDVSQHLDIKSDPGWSRTIAFLGVIQAS